MCIRDSDEPSVGDDDQERWTRVDRVSTGIQAPCYVDTCTPGHTEPNPVIGIQPVKLASPELTQPSIVHACIGDDSAAALRTRCSLSVVFFGAPIKRLPRLVYLAGDERMDESSGRVVDERASDAAQLSKLKEAFGTGRGDVLVRGQIRRQ